MKALVFRSQDDPALMDVDAPSAGPEEVLVRSRRVGICHSDIVLLEGDYTIPVTYPVIPGHEWAGEVLEVGPGVTAFTRQATMWSARSSSASTAATTSGSPSTAQRPKIFKVRAEWLHPIPESLTWTQAALVEPFSIAYNATVALGGVYPGDVIAVFGAGPIGLLSVLAAMANGGPAVVIEPSESRRAASAGARGERSPRSAFGGNR